MYADARMMNEQHSHEFTGIIINFVFYIVLVVLYVVVVLYTCMELLVLVTSYDEYIINLKYSFLMVCIIIIMYFNFTCACMDTLQHKCTLNALLI